MQVVDRGISLVEWDSVRNGSPSVTLRTLLLAARTTGVVVGSVVGCALLAVTLPALVGYHNLTIMSGSVGGARPTGSVAVTRTIDFRDVRCRVMRSCLRALLAVSPH